MSEPLVLIPGMMADARLFAQQVIDLSRKFAVMVMLPTVGGSVDEISAHMLAHCPPRFALAGLGLGAHVALDLMRRDMARVTKVVLMSADPLGEAPEVAALREKRMIMARTGRLSQAMIEELPLGALAPSDRREDILALAEDMAFALGPEVFVAQSRALQRRRDQQKTLRRARIPALVLAGDKDGLVSPRRQSFMAGLMPMARIQVVAGAGHLLPLEQPEVVSRAMDSFLSGPLLLR